MGFKSVLIANRGEIAIRIARALADLQINSVAVYAQDDAEALHRRLADCTIALPGQGTAAYLDGEALIAAAREARCDAIHPGYGFLSESAAFATAVRAAGLGFIGPEPEFLALFGDKAAARALATRLEIPIIAGTGSLDLAGAQAFVAAHGPTLLKAVAGGGGRGLRAVFDVDSVEPAFHAARREAQAAFGHDGLYAERFIAKARHIEVQLAGDGVALLALGDRDCSVQRRFQKIIEIAPAPQLSPAMRTAMTDAALRLCAGYRTLATVEFLLDVEHETFACIEVNARLQVEHTITEAVTGNDLVQTQIRLAAGETLAEIGLTTTHPARGYAVQARVNLETLHPDGQTWPSEGRISRYEPPTGPGIRVDGQGFGGFQTTPGFDPLLAKVIGQGDSLTQACQRTARALAEFRIEGVDTNLGLLRVLLRRDDVQSGQATTRLIDDAAVTLVASAAALCSTDGPSDPMAEAAEADVAVPEGLVAINAPLTARVGAVSVAVGDRLRPGQEVAILEAMKMEHQLISPNGGHVTAVLVQPGGTVRKDAPILFIAPLAGETEAAAAVGSVDVTRIRPDLAQVIARHRFTQDETRPDAVARRRKTGHRTARENIDDLLDPGSFIEYGALAIAAQRRRRSVEDLIANTPADGIITGIGTVNAELFSPERTRVAALAYDFTVLAGTQGHFNHKKTDRLLHIVRDQRLPLVWFAEGGGGRPGDTDATGVAGLDVPTFRTLAELSGDQPKIAIVAGRCFAGNAAVAGLCEVLIATRDSNLGMGGPAMIEGGGLGSVKPEEIGPSATQWANGVIDLLAESEAHATALAKQALSYFQGCLPEFTAADPNRLRGAIPENRLRVYDIRALITALVDEGGFLELRGGYAPGMVTGLIRIAGRPMGLIANDPRHLGGAIDCAGAEKAARFLQLCDAMSLPVLSLCDTPGFMVGPESEAAGAVRRVSRLFIAGAKLGVPLFTVVLRKGYGLGAQAMAGGSFTAPTFIVAWPTGEFGGMGLEGAVRLGYRKELEAQIDPAARQALFDQLVANLYARGQATSMAAALEIDAVIDPADTRRWILAGLDSCPARHRPWAPRVDSC